MQYSLCIDSICPQENLEEKLTRIKQTGFKFIEFWDWRDKNFELIINSGLKVSNFSGNRISSLTLDNKEKVIQEVNVSIDAAKKLKCDRIMLLSDILEGDGSEKPIALDVEKIDQAIAAVKKAGVKLQVGFNRRFDPSFKKAKDLMAKGTIGTPHLVRITSRDPEPPPISYVKVSGGIFLDMMIHDFDMARYLLNQEVVELM
ncbi:unnamed protein product, partial [marine sediment metagenome]